MTKRIMVIILIVMCLLPLTLNVAHADITDPSVLTIEVKHGEVPIPGMNIAICRIALAHEVGGSIVFAATTEFSGAGVNFADMDTNEKWIAMAASLNVFATAHGVARTVQVTNSQGRVRFEGLSAGLYLVVQQSAADSIYTVAPYIVMVPYYNEILRDWENDFVSLAKVERDDDIINLSVLKMWVGVSPPYVPVDVQLYRNGVPFGDPITLNAANAFTYTWEDLDPSYTWTVDEVHVPPGYERTITSNVANSFVITNTRTTPEPSVTPGPSGTPVPSATPEPSDTPEPSPGPTNTPSPTSPPHGGGPKTVDDSNMGLWIAVVTVGGLGLLAVILVWIAASKRLNGTRTPK